MRGMRNILLKVMLWALAIGAGLGALLFLVAERDIVWRVVATAVIAAGAAALMMGAMAMIDRPTLRWAGALTGMVIVIEFLGAVFLVWCESVFGPWWFYVERIALTMVVLAVMDLLAAVFLSALSFPRTAWCGRTGAAACALVFATWLLAIWWPGGRPWGYGVPEHLGLTGWALALFGLAAALALLGLQRGDRRYWRWVGVAASAVGAGCLTWRIWTEGEGYEVVFAIIAALGAIPAYAGLALTPNLRARQAWVPYVGIAAMGGVAFCVVSMVYVEGPGNHGSLTPTGEYLGRGAGALGVAAASALLSVLVLARLNKPAQPVELPHQFKDITVVCPRCQKQQALSLGMGRCAGCHLEIHTRIVEPCCPQCGYLIYSPTTDRCPECGAALTPAEPGMPDSPVEVKA